MRSCRNSRRGSGAGRFVSDVSGSGLWRGRCLENGLHSMPVVRLNNPLTSGRTEIQRPGFLPHGKTALNGHSPPPKTSLYHPESHPTPGNVRRFNIESKAYFYCFFYYFLYYSVDCCISNRLIVDRVAGQRNFAEQNEWHCSGFAAGTAWVPIVHCFHSKRGRKCLHAHCWFVKS